MKIEHDYILAGFHAEMEKVAFWGLLGRAALGTGKLAGKALFGNLNRGMTTVFGTMAVKDATGRAMKAVEPEMLFPRS